MHILIGTDGSDDAIAAAQRGLSLLAPPDRITVVSVAETPTIAAAGLESGFTGGVASPAEIDAAWAGVHEETTTALERTISALLTGATVDTEVVQGAPGPSVCERAAELGVDVVVVGSRGLGVIRRALLGSVSTYVVNNAPCPVLVVRAGADE